LLESGHGRVSTGRSRRGSFTTEDTESTEGAQSSKGEAADPVAQDFGVEVDDESDWLSRESQIGQKLRLVNWVGLFDCLYFEDHCVVDEEVESVRRLDAFPSIVDGERKLSMEGYGPEGEFASQTRFIG
jgi:hypothetical protein